MCSKNPSHHLSSGQEESHHLVNVHVRVHWYKLISHLPGLSWATPTPLRQPPPPSSSSVPSSCVSSACPGSASACGHGQTWCRRRHGRCSSSSWAVEIGWATHTTFVNEWSVGLFATSKLRITQTVIDVLPMQPVTYTRNLLNPIASFSPHKSVIKS